VQFFGPRSPLGLKLSSNVPDSDLQELADHTLFRVRYIVIAIRKDAHANKTPGRSRREVTSRESISAGIRLVDNGEGEGVKGPPQRIDAGGALVARIFMQNETGKKLRSLPGDAIGNFVPVNSAKRTGTVLPISRVVVWWIKHLEACPKCRQNHGGRAKGLWM
jgi:hypothetical protein